MFGAGEVMSWLRAFAALAGDLSSAPSIHKVVKVAGKSTTTSDLCEHQARHCIHTCTQAKHSYKKGEAKRKKKEEEGRKQAGKLTFL